MTQLENIDVILKQHARSEGSSTCFFKTGPGSYAAHDRFIGVSNPVLRKIAKEFADLTPAEIQALLYSSLNEHRLLALFILVRQYQKASNAQKQEIYCFYLQHIEQVNNWNLVDASAHLIIGTHLIDKEKDLLLEFAQSDNLWKRRIAIVATWFFIRKNLLDWTFKIAKQLLNDTHDLIHKAVGWMLREAGKKDALQLITFLDQHASQMPRTMLRYAIEKFPEDQRKKYLKITRK